MTTKSGPDSSKPGKHPPTLALPADLDRTLRYLDDRQLERLQQAVAAEARRRDRQARDQQQDDGGKLSAGPAPRGRRDAGTEPAGPAAKARSVSPGQERLIRASFKAGLKPAAIARELHVPRSEVERIIAGLKQLRS